MLVLGDLKGFDENKVLNHLSREYTGSGPYEEATVDQSKEALEMLRGFNVLIAYESVGSWGCDSNSFFLLKSKESGDLFEIHGSHCSCYGFEGQLDLEPSCLEVLKSRILGSGGVFYTGGYDDDSEENTKKVNDFILGL